MKTVSVKVASAVIAGLGLATGAVGVVGAQVVGETGDDSSNNVIATNDDRRETTKSATVDAVNNNPQTAVSGDAEVNDGDDNGTAETGAAGNESELTGDVTVDQQNGTNNNSGAGGTGDVSGTTGEDSDNNVESHNTVRHTDERNATVDIVNNNTQTAVSGNATVDDGDDGGKATTGDATNKSTTSFTVNVKQ